jgi:hypothetical protein
MFSHAAPSLRSRDILVKGGKHLVVCQQIVGMHLGLIIQYEYMVRRETFESWERCRSAMRRREEHIQRRFSQRFREHSINFRKHSVNFKEHSVNFREHSVNFAEHSVNLGNIQSTLENIVSTLGDECPSVAQVPQE